MTEQPKSNIKISATADAKKEANTQKNNKFIVITSAAVVTLLAIGGLTTWYLTNNHGAKKLTAETGITQTTKRDTKKLLERSHFAVVKKGEKTPDNVISFTKMKPEEIEKKAEALMKKGETPRIDASEALATITQTGGSQVMKNHPQDAAAITRYYDDKGNYTNPFVPDVKPGTLPRIPKISLEENAVAAMVQAHLLRANDYCRSGSGYYGKDVLNAVRKGHLNDKMYNTENVFKDAATRLGTAAYDAQMVFSPMHGPVVNNLLENYVKRGLFDVDWNAATSYSVKATSGDKADRPMFHNTPVDAEVSFTVNGKTYTFMTTETRNGYRVIDVK